MVSLNSLWLPILLSAVFVFVASSIAHMVLPYHRGDYRKVPNESEVMDALRKFKVTIDGLAWRWLPAIPT